MTGTIKLVTVRVAGSLTSATFLMKPEEIAILSGYGTDYFYVTDRPAETVTAAEALATLEKIKQEQA